jgi:hypothetical protein
MTEQPEALRLADAMLHYWDERGPDAEAVAAELRRLHEEAASLRDQNTELDRRLVEMEQAGRQALEVLENAEDQLAKPYSTEAGYAIAALRQALGGKHE